MGNPATEHRMRFEVASGDGWFAGHFAGRPILPGIAHLALLRDGLRAALGPLAAIGALDGLRWRRVVVPGDTLELRLTGVAFGRPARFELKSGEAVASGGSVTPVEGMAAPAVAASRPEVGPPGAWPAPAKLIPHRPPALLLERVTGVEADRLTAVGRVPPGSPFADGGAAPAFVGLELAAQAAAAFEALARRRDGGNHEPRVGYLVGVRQARFSAPLPVATELMVAITMTGAALPLATYELAVRAGDTLCATGSISTFMKG